ncbi:MAG: DUF47 family protein [Anaerolineae bacterium]|nr:DUF47 family protein [Anaerolineae bacterium]
MRAPLLQRSGRPKSSPFAARLLRQTEYLVEGTQALGSFMNAPTRDHALRVRDVERAADEVRRALIAQLRKTFITPIDREDLFGLSRALDDVLDHVYSTTRDMFVLKVVPNDHLQAMTAVVYQCAKELNSAIQYLETQPRKAGQHAVRVRALENRMDNLYVKALADLYDNGSMAMDDVVKMFKLREIYRHMIHAIKSAEQAADLIDDIIVKFY